jgi:hypothetical protein
VGGYSGSEKREAQTFLNELNRAIAAGEIEYHPFG